MQTAVFKELSPNDVRATKSYLNQLIDVIQEDISGSSTRKKYQHFVTGGVGPGITSSLFQTVYDQDFSLQTANALFDISVGLYESGSTAISSKTGVDNAGKILFTSSSVMMREKIDIYRQAAQNLLGDATSRFAAPYDSTTTANQINEALFINYKRLFSRDAIKRETFAMKFYQTASTALGGNLRNTSETGMAIYTDVGAGTNKNAVFGGNVGSIVDASATSRVVGLMFYDRGTAILDLAKCISGSQEASGTIDAMNADGSVILGHPGTETPEAKFIPDFLVSASMDNIIDHFASSRFSSGSLSAMTFQNITNINSTMIFCRAEADEFNYSSNPTFVNSDNRLRVIDVGSEDVQRSFTFVTTVGLLDANNNLLAVAKLSRPIEKSDQKDLTIRVRLDFANKTKQLHINKHNTSIHIAK